MLQSKSCETVSVIVCYIGYHVYILPWLLFPSRKCHSLVITWYFIERTNKENWIENVKKKTNSFDEDLAADYYLKVKVMFITILNVFHCCCCIANIKYVRVSSCAQQKKKKSVEW